MNHRALLLLALLLVAVGLVTSALTASARPFSPGYFVHTQADGAKLVISMAGSDERVRFAKTVDGYTLLDDGKGNYVYAVQDAKGNLVTSNVKAHDLGKRGASEKTFVAKLAKGLAFTQAQLAAKRPKPKRRQGLGTQALLSPYAFPTIGSDLKHLAIAVDFPDCAWTLSLDSLWNAFNEEGYQSPVEGQTGSFRDFYIENSYGQLSINTTVVGPYRMAHNYAYYGANVGGWDAHQGEMVTEAVNAAAADGVDFSQYDNDSNSWCDPVCIVFAGYGEQGGADSDHLIICMNSLYCEGLPVVTKNEVKICAFYLIPECRGSSGGEQEAIGSATHEFGHALWLWDTYGGSYPMNCWDQMAMGCWAGGWGDAPTHHAAYGKALLGWYTPTTLSTPQSGLNLRQAATNAECYMIETATPGEYFLLENRQQNYFDFFLPGHGMLIMHCAGDSTCYLTPADNSFACSPEGQEADVFPGTTNNTSFTDTSTPNAKSWANEDTGKPVTNISENDGVISFDFMGSVPEPPSAPSDLTATAISDAQINLAWTDNSDNENGFKIERKTGAAGSFAEIDTVAADVTSYADAGLSPSTTYYYRVRAYNVVGNSAYSNTASATTFAIPPPSGLTATAMSNSRIDLAWQDNSSSEISFRIERKVGAGGAYVQIEAVGPGPGSGSTLTYSNNGLGSNVTYYYRVRAYTAGGSSACSGEAHATTYALLGPTNLTARATSLTQINLTWTDNSRNETGYIIERSVGDDDSWEPAVATGMDVVSYADAGLTPNTTHYYRVRAYNATGSSAYSNVAAAATPGPPPAPSELTATAVSMNQINLAWTDNAGNETGFKIQRRKGTSTSWSTIKTVGANVTSWSNTGLPYGTQYYYRVYAYNSQGASAYANEADATTLYPVANPTDLAAQAVSSSQINLTWTDNSTNESGFKIQRRKGTSTSWSTIKTVGANITSYSNTGLSAATLYHYRVRAYNSKGNSAYSNEADATTF